ncbi:hypothetical protein ANN_00612 [Periplaneta americana]|uniref:Uncharacterized protein n=1 Tax=Periplaneta americana TaxID=6978 RepID=A0ABQ8TRA6_PERAM|nr:hypothetical protein ANN_00612 [Periplaneta americana]
MAGLCEGGNKPPGSSNAKLIVITSMSKLARSVSESGSKQIAFPKRTPEKNQSQHHRKSEGNVPKESPVHVKIHSIKTGMRAINETLLLRGTTDPATDTFDSGSRRGSDNPERKRKTNLE